MTKVVLGGYHEFFILHLIIVSLFLTFFEDFLSLFVSSGYSWVVRKMLCQVLLNVNLYFVIISLFSFFVVPNSKYNINTMVEYNTRRKILNFLQKFNFRSGKGYLTHDVIKRLYRLRPVSYFRLTKKNWVLTLRANFSNFLTARFSFYPLNVSIKYIWRWLNFSSLILRYNFGKLKYSSSKFFFRLIFKSSHLNFKRLHFLRLHKNSIFSENSISSIDKRTNKFGFITRFLFKYSDVFNQNSYKKYRLLPYYSFLQKINVIFLNKFTTAVDSFFLSSFVFKFVSKSAFGLSKFKSLFILQSSFFFEIFNWFKTFSYIFLFSKFYKKFNYIYSKVFIWATLYCSIIFFFR